MSKEKLGQESAFPLNEECRGMHGEIYFITTPGINKRFYAACAAMQGLLASPNTAFQILNSLNGIADKEEADKILINQSYILADELLKQENE